MSDWEPPTEELFTRSGRSLGRGDRLHCGEANGGTRIHSDWLPFIPVLAGTPPPRGSYRRWPYQVDAMLAQPETRAGLPSQHLDVARSGWWQLQWAMPQPIGSHSGMLVALAFTPDCRQLITVSTDYTAKLWDVLTGRLVRVFRGHTDEIASAVFSLDGKWLVTAAKDRSCRVWDVCAGHELMVLEHNTSELFTAAISPDRRYIITGTSYGASLWELPSGDLLDTLDSPPVAALAFTADCRRILLGSYGGVIECWDLSSTSRLMAHSLYSRAVKSVVLSPEGQRFAICGDDPQIYMGVVEQLQCHPVPGHFGRVADVTFSADGQRLFVVNHDRHVLIISATTGEIVGQLKGDVGPLAAVAASVDGSMVAACGHSTVKLWDLRTDELLHPPPMHRSNVVAMAFSADSARLITGAADDRVCVWDVEGGWLLHTLDSHGHGSTNAVALSPDGRFAASGGIDKVAYVWDLVTGRQLHRFEDSWYITALAFSTHGKWLAAGNSVWNVTTGQLLVRLGRPGEITTAVAFTPSGHVLHGNSQGEVRVWHVETGKRLHTFGGHQEGVAGIAIAPDGNLAISAERAHKIYAWDVAGGRLVRVIKAEFSEPVALGLSPDSRVVWAAYARGWCSFDIASGTRLPPSFVYRPPANHVDFEWTTFNRLDRLCATAIAPNGRHLAISTPTRWLLLYQK